ncbi:hypothetical protein WG66_000735 [Moniliophthora roreri]|uniref:Uncharacterized protein n=1 Tax=Moniliophthora roreri TaxID=221103 RepID=A0A0W0FLT6_MONRR|nr:hypothetical protein WG66_000735 [Moniliophthora roreri]
MGKGKKKGGMKANGSASPKPATTKFSLFSAIFCERCNNDNSTISYPGTAERSSFLSVVEATEAITRLRDEERELTRCDEEIARLGQVMTKLESEKLAYDKRTSLCAVSLELNGPSTSSGVIHCERCGNELLSFSYPGPMQGQPLYSERISLVCRLAAQVEAEKLAIEGRIQARRIVISRSQRRDIPNAIWKQIFSEVIRDPHGTDESLTLAAGSRSVPLTLSHVCSDWRAIAHSHPVLWCTISVWLSMLTKDYTLLLATFLKQSKGVPLTVRMFDARLPGWHSESGSPKRVGRYGIRALTLLMTQAFRFQVLELTLFDWGILSQWKQGSVAFPILEQFSALGLSLLDPGNEDAINRPTLAWFWDAIRNAPKLLTWVTDRVKADVFRMAPQHSHGQGQRVVIVCTIGIQAVIQLLRNARVASLVVEDLAEDMDESQGDEGISREQLEAPHLKDLDIRSVNDPSLVNDLFSLLVLPRLKALNLKYWISNSGENSPLTLPTVAPMLQRSTWLLSHLTLDIKDIYVSDRTLGDLLGARPYLRSIGLATVTRNSRKTGQPSFNLFTALTIGATESAHSLLLPRLEELRLSEDNLFFSDPHNADELLKALEFRSRSGLAARGRTANDIAVLNIVEIDSLCHSGPAVPAMDKRHKECKLGPEMTCLGNYLYQKSYFERLQALKRDGMSFNLRFTVPMEGKIPFHTSPTFLPQLDDPPIHIP